jgi:hypothetical protein
VSAQDAAVRGEQVVVDFDHVDAAASLSGRIELAEVRADGNAFGRVRARGDGPLRGQLVFALPEGVRPGSSGGFSFRIRSLGGATDARLVALDAEKHVVLQRRVDVAPADRLRPVTVPWTQWRWGDDVAGGPAEIRSIGIRFTAPGGELHVDDLAFTAPAARDAGREWLRRVAFGGRDVCVAEADGLLVATDAVGGDAQLAEADLAAILGRMRRARTLIRRLFADAVDPVETVTPPSLLIFRRREDYVAFFQSLGKEWNVQVAPPTGGGLTVGNLAATTFDPKQGADRPVFLHESVHAIFASDVRLLSGHDRHSWLHEGLGSYVQLCVYPRSIDRRALAANFRSPVAPDGRSFFKPLAQVLGRKVPAQQYAQVGTLVAYLVDQKPQWLPAIAKSLAAGGTAEDAFGACGVNLGDLQDAWLKWGAEKVGEGGDAGAMLPLPQEFAPAEPGAAGTKP